jgi:hypothetical protein
MRSSRSFPRTRAHAGDVAVLHRLPHPRPQRRRLRCRHTHKRENWNVPSALRHLDALGLKNRSHHHPQREGLLQQPPPVKDNGPRLGVPWVRHTTLLDVSSSASATAFSPWPYFLKSSQVSARK